VNGLLLDTNVLSELERPRPSTGVMTFVRHTTLDEMFLSDVIIAEIRFGIDATATPLRRDQLTKWLRDVIRPMFVGRILPVSEDIFVRWRWILEAGRRSGYTFEQTDALIAATAAHHGLTVVTRDMTPFARADVACLNPWLE
jgi:predicted nucleic acid-binding protein